MNNHVLEVQFHKLELIDQIILRKVMNFQLINE